MPIIESFLVSVFANVATNLGQTVLKKVLKKDLLYYEIEDAYTNALKKWSRNTQIQDNQKVWLSQRMEQLIICIKDPEKIKDLDTQLSSLINFFKLELQQKTVAWNYFQEVQNQEKLTKIISIERHLEKLVNDIGNIVFENTPINKDFLLPYQEAFKKQLLPSAKNLPLYFNNHFYGREKEFQELDYLVKYSNSTIAVIAGGGYGKTRFSIEYFKKLLVSGENYNVLVLISNDISTIDLNSKIEESKQNLILIDDAHKRTEILNELITFCNRRDNVKLLLTIRENVLSDTLNSIPTHNRKIEPIELKRISYTDSQKIIRSLIKGIPEIDIKKLAEKSKGVPIVILGICESIVTKGNASLNDDMSFLQFVREVKKQAINDIHNKHSIEREKINKTIELISVFSPLNNLESEIKLIAEYNSLSFEETDLIINYLIETNLVYKHYNEISIKPDPYSDIYLLDASFRIKHLLEKKEINQFIDRIIRNIVELENSDNLKYEPYSILIDFIKSFKKKRINDFNDVKSINRNVKTLGYFAYKKPDVCVEAISNLISANEDNPEFWRNKTNLDESISNVLAISALNTDSKDTLEDIYSILSLYEKHMKGGNNFKNIFRFRIYDFREFNFSPKAPLLRQQFLLNKIRLETNTDSISKVDLETQLNLFEILLSLEYDGESHMDNYDSTYYYSKAYVPCNQQTKQLRLSALELILQIHNRFNEVLDTYLAFEMLIDILFFTIKRNSELEEFNQAHEVDFVLTSIENLIDSQDALKERGIILRKLRLFELREYKEEYTDRMEKFFRKVKRVESLKSRLHLLIIDDYYYLMKNGKIEFNKIVSDYANWDELIIDLITFCEYLKPTYKEQFQETLNFIISDHPEKAKILLDKVINTKPELVGDFASLVRANFTNTVYFYETIEKIKKVEIESNKHVVLWMLIFGRNQDFNYLKKEDLKYFKTYLNKKDIRYFNNIGYGFPFYLKVAPEETIEIIKKVIKISEHNNLPENVLFSFFNNKFLFDENPLLVKEFIFDFTLGFGMDKHFMSNVYPFLEDKFGFEILLDYLIKKHQYLSDREYFSDFKPVSNYGTSETKKEDEDLNFIIGLKHFALGTKKVTLGILRFLKPQKRCSQHLLDELEKVMLDYLDEKEKIIRFCEGLSIFESESKNENLLSFFIRISSMLLEQTELNSDDLIRIFSREFTYNLGSKSGRPGEPFPIDIMRKKILKQFLEIPDLKIQLKEYFEKVLETVERAIGDSRGFDSRNKW